MPIKRTDDFESRREHLKNLSEVELEQRFWRLAEEVVNPLLELAYNNTTPSIERSVLLRMGFSSLEAKGIVDGALDRGLLGRGAGHIVWRVSEFLARDYREVGREIACGQHWDLAVELFKGGAK